MAGEIVYGLMEFLHTFFATIWIGGLLTLGLIVFPIIKKNESIEKKQKLVIMDKIKNRLSPIIYLSIIVLFITGLLLGKHSGQFAGIFVVINTYTLIVAIKHVLVIVMTIIAILRSRIVDRLNLEPNKKMKLMGVLIIINMILGIAVLLLSGLSVAFGTAAP